MTSMTATMIADLANVPPDAITSAMHDAAALTEELALALDHLEPLVARARSVLAHDPVPDAGETLRHLVDAMTGRATLRRLLDEITTAVS